MKRIISVLICFIMIISLFACVKDDGQSGTPDADVKSGDGGSAGEGGGSGGEKSGEEAGGEAPYVPPAPRQITVQDSDGATVTTPADNAKIACLGYEAVSLLIALGAKGNIAAIDRLYPDRPLILRALPEAAKLPQVAGEDGVPDIEKLAQSGAGLVILTDEYAQYADALRERGLTAAVVRFETVEEVKDSALLVGKLSNTDAAAEDIASYYDSALERLKIMTSVETPVTVNVFADDPVITDLLRRLNCNFELDTATVVAKASAPAPQTAIKAPCGVEPWDEPGVSLVLGLYWYACKLYPSVISRDEAANRAKSFYTTFYGVEFTGRELGTD